MSSNIVDIVEGTVNNLFKKEEDLYQERVKICRACKLYKIDNLFGEVCNKNLYLNPKTDEVSTSPKKYYVRGCGCILQSKCRLPRAKCPAGKW